MILSRGRELSGSAAILGLKVEGDRLLDTGIRGALIEKVKKGSIADVEGQLRPGKLFPSSFPTNLGRFFQGMRSLSGTGGCCAALPRAKLPK